MRIIGARTARFLFSLGMLFAFVPLSFAGVQSIPGAGELSSVSARPVAGDDTLDKLQMGGLKVLHTVKVLVSFLAVIYIVYSGAMLVTAMGDEKTVTSQKRQLMYSLVAFLFINIPGEIYALFARKQVSSVTQNLSGSFTHNVTSGSNIFVNFFEWNSTVENGILSFFRIGIIGGAVLMFTLAAFELIASGGSDDKMKHAK